MKYLAIALLTIMLSACHSNSQRNTSPMISQSSLNNDTIKNHEFLSSMYQDSYFPDFLVDKCKAVLLELCQNIEQKNPQSLEELYALTHSATDKINDLEDDFNENGSEIETGARECLAVDFEFIAHAYGFKNADIEELIATREW